MTERVVLAGGTGFLGRALTKALLERENDVVVLTRQPEREPLDGVSYLGWDGKTLADWANALDGATAVVNLAGRSVNCRHTEKNRRDIIDSRVDSVCAIAAAIRRARHPPSVLVQAASLAIYGDPGNRECTEAAPVGTGFSADVCVAWERAFDDESTPATRRVLLRIGFVLGRRGGAFEVLARLTRRFLGGSVASGEQFVSWLHLCDMVRVLTWCLDHSTARGVYNATGPNPVTNAEFMRELRRALGRPWSPPTPAWAVALGSRLMGTDPSLALTGRRCVPRRLLDEGFRFDFPELRGALDDLT
jgi:uncharacterized protein (TIGR01777 family)